MIRIRVKIIGVVQGVGFRPEVYNLANKLKLTGFIFNDLNGVTIEIQGQKKITDEFIESLKKNPPRAARIDAIIFKEIKTKKEKEILIKPSKYEGVRQSLSPDISICPDCQKELFDPKNRRYLYPFINCYSCGPRFTFIKKMPYDRRNTTMSGFKMCLECAAEYNDPKNRRFHAEPIACSKCGPALKLIDKKGKEISKDSIREAVKLIKKGKIIAVKGLGGYQLICDAGNKEAVNYLREAKNRPHKPLAIMVDEGTLKKIAQVSAEEIALLKSASSPIVLVKKKKNNIVAENVASGVNEYGVMLPYTPLHQLLIKEAGEKVLVVTSGNLSGHSIIFKDQEALKSLSKIADYFLMHNREITVGYDDSVARIVNKEPLVIRASRGVSPLFFKRDKDLIPALAMGADLKNSFALSSGKDIILSQYIGDMGSASVKKRWLDVRNLYEELFNISPQVVVADLHPGYETTKIAENLGLPVYQFQHHKAHIASVAFEHSLSEPVIGVAFDGLGYGEDGNFWGGEFFSGDPCNLNREHHLAYFPLLGGDIASVEPVRAALSLVLESKINSERIKKIFGDETNDKIFNLKTMYEKKINSPLTSSMGRLFDAASYFIGFRGQNTYEGEAACYLESMAEEAEEKYRYSVENRTILVFKIIEGMIKDLESGVKKEKIAGKFQRTVLEIIVSETLKISKETGIRTVCLSGGVFQNRYLLENTLKKLSKKGFNVYYNKMVPISDGGIALGQLYLLNCKGPTLTKETINVSCHPRSDKKNK